MQILMKFIINEKFSNSLEFLWFSLSNVNNFLKQIPLSNKKFLPSLLKAFNKIQWKIISWLESQLRFWTNIFVRINIQISMKRSGQFLFQSDNFSSIQCYVSEIIKHNAVKFSVQV